MIDFLATSQSKAKSSPFEQKFTLVPEAIKHSNNPSIKESPRRVTKSIESIKQAVEKEFKTLPAQSRVYDMQKSHTAQVIPSTNNNCIQLNNSYIIINNGCPKNVFSSLRKTLGKVDKPFTEVRGRLPDVYSN